MLDWEESNNSYNWEHGCCECGKPFEKGEHFVRTDIPNGWFRGDDDVYTFHKGCFKQFKVDKDLFEFSPKCGKKHD